MREDMLAEGKEIMVTQDLADTAWVEHQDSCRRVDHMLRQDPVIAHRVLGQITVSWI